MPGYNAPKSVKLQQIESIEQWHPFFFVQPRETNIDLKNRVVEVLHCSTEGRETTFGSSYVSLREFR